MNDSHDSRRQSQVHEPKQKVQPLTNQASGIVFYQQLSSFDMTRNCQLSKSLVYWTVAINEKNLNLARTW